MILDTKCFGNPSTCQFGYVAYFTWELELRVVVLLRELIYCYFRVFFLLLHRSQFNQDIVVQLFVLRTTPDVGSALPLPVPRMLSIIRSMLSQLSWPKLALTAMFCNFLPWYLLRMFLSIICWFVSLANLFYVGSSCIIQWRDMILILLDFYNRDWLFGCFLRLHQKHSNGTKELQLGHVKHAF